MKRNDFSKTALAIASICGFIMAVSEGSTWCWANVVGLMIFGCCGRKLGFFKQE